MCGLALALFVVATLSTTLSSTNHTWRHPPPTEEMSSFKGSPSSHDSISGRLLLMNGGDDGGGAASSSSSMSLLPRDFSLVSITSSNVSGGTVGPDEFFKCRDHAERTLQHMQHYLDNQQLCDVILIAGIDGKK